MTEDETNLWERVSRGDETARKELILSYMPLVNLLAKRIALDTRANWKDLSQDGAIGLMKAVARFDHSQRVPFKYFAKPYIRGAIYDSPELTHNLARGQEEVYRKMRRVEDELTKTLQRNPTIEEVAEKAGLTVEQIRTAIDARGVAFAGELPDAEEMPPSYTIDPSRSERESLLMEALSQLDARVQQIIHLYYWEDQPHEEIAQKLGLTASNVTKIRQRAIARLRAQLDL
jgi:RNA polymerase sporulation-specific sigma factor